MTQKLSRREFLKLSSIAIGAAALPTLSPNDLRLAAPSMGLGRVTVLGLRLMKRPRWTTDLIRTTKADEVVEIYRAVVGEGKPFVHNNVWFEVEGGYLNSSWVQPVKNEPQTPVTSPLPLNGFFGEIYVPYTDAYESPDTKSKIVYRLYFSTVSKIDKLQQVNGTTWYHLFDEEKPFGFWVDGKTMRIITPEEITPLSPDVTDKRIIADLDTHWLSAFEGKTEVFRTRFASGASFFDPVSNQQKLYITPGGKHPISRKFVSTHMAGGVAPNGYDLPGVGWVSIFATGGAAIHSTYWHNDYGRPRSHGCLNCTPDAAKWLFRWTTPEVTYSPGKIEVPWPGGTRVEVEGTPPTFTNDGSS